MPSRELRAPPTCSGSARRCECFATDERACRAVGIVAFPCVGTTRTIFVNGDTRCPIGVR